MMCSSWVSFWYVSVAVFFDLDPAGASTAMLSFSISARGLPLDFLAAGAFFCFLVLGGVWDIIEPESKPSFIAESPSSSLPGFGRFFVAGFAFRVACNIFLGAGF